MYACILDYHYTENYQLKTSPLEALPFALHMRVWCQIQDEHYCGFYDIIKQALKVCSVSTKMVLFTKRRSVIIGYKKWM